MSLWSEYAGGPRARTAAPYRTGLFTRLNNGLAWRLHLRRVTLGLERPLASFTFDDFPKSAWTIGGSILRQYDAAATYYVAGRFCGIIEDGVRYYDAEDLRELHAAGNEIGCHTYMHRQLPQLTPRQLLAEWDRNQAFVRGLVDGVELSSFAYPFGAVSVVSKVMASYRFQCSRGIRSGVNSGSIDLDQLSVVRLESQNWTARSVEEQVAAAKETNGWIVFMSHDLSEDPTPFGIRPSGLDHALATVRSAEIEILPVGQALNRVISS